MSKHNLTDEAIYMLGKKVSTYKEAIIEKAFDLHPQGDITAEDINEASKAIEIENKRNNEAIGYNIKKQRIYLMILIMSTLYLFVGVIFLLFESSSITDQIENLNIYIIILSFIISTMSFCFVLILRIKKKRMPDKRKSICKFINNWNVFERMLRIKYQQINSNKEPSFFEIMEFLLGTYDEKYSNKADDFNFVLKLRNRIIHDQYLDKISLDDISKAIAILDKLQKSINNKEIS